MRPDPVRPLHPGRPAPAAILLAFFLPAIAFLLCAAVVTAAGTAAGYDHTRWLALHLFLVGGVSGLILGAAPFFTGAFLATGPAPRLLRRTQLVSWNAGAVLVPIGVLRHLDPVNAAGGVLLLIGLGAFALSLRAQVRRSLRRHPWPAYWYLTAALLLVLGVFLGMLTADGSTALPGDPVAAHRTLNLAGWIGGAILGTLHTFYPALTRTRLAYPGLERPTYAAWLAGTLAAAGGYAVDVRPLIVAGYALLIIAAALLVTNGAAAVRRSPAITLPAQLVGTAQLMLLAGLLAALVSAVRPASELAARADDALLELLVAGWVGLTALGALIHLLGTVSRSPASRHQHRRASDAPIVGLAAAGLVAIVVSELVGGTPIDLVARVAVGVAYLCLTVHVLRLAVHAVRIRPPTI